jgi:hypothetical protein
MAGRRPNKAMNVWQHIQMHEGDPSVCWEWSGRLSGRDGRPYFSIAGYEFLAYRVVYELAYNDQLTEGDVIMHLCDNPACCNPAHLQKGSQQQNMRDMLNKRRTGLPRHTTAFIKKLIRLDKSDADIAEITGVSRSLINEIRHNKRELHK